MYRIMSLFMKLLFNIEMFHRYFPLIRIAIARKWMKKKKTTRTKHLLRNFRSKWQKFVIYNNGFFLRIVQFNILVAWWVFFSSSLTVHSAHFSCQWETYKFNQHFHLQILNLLTEKYLCTFLFAKKNENKKRKTHHPPERAHSRSSSTVCWDEGKNISKTKQTFAISE